MDRNIKYKRQIPVNENKIETKKTQKNKAGQVASLEAEKDYTCLAAGAALPNVNLIFNTSTPRRLVSSPLT